jgi:hypothetical protein
MFKAVWNDTEYVLVSLPSLTDSSRETKFSDIQVDFRGKTDSDLPLQYQEIKIIDEDDTLYLMGYVDSVDFPEFRFEDQPFIITISLLSPYAYASKRTISMTIDTIPLNTTIVDILQPLLDDGFTIEENTLKTRNVSEIFQAETIEKVVNYLANKFDFVWYIDKFKKIYLKDINVLKSQTPVIEITATDKCYLQSIKPTKTVVDYANKLLIKNAILLSGVDLGVTWVDLVKGQSYKFEYPFSISENTAFRLPPRNEIGDTEDTAYLLRIETNADTYEIKVYLESRIIEYDINIGILGVDDDSKAILLEVDANDPTKVIGFKWGLDMLSPSDYEFATITQSDSGLVPILFSFIDPTQIANIKDKVNTSGIIERTIDANLKYFTYDELLQTVQSLFGQNNTATSEVNCTFKGRLDDTDFMAIANLLDITKTFSVELPSFLTSGTFVITDKELSMDTETMTIKIKGRNFNLNENFNDIFRSPIEQLNENDLVNTAVVLYNQDNKTVISKEIIVDGEVVNDD